MAEKRLATSFNEALMRDLRFGGIDKENLEELVGIVAAIKKSGLSRVKVFPKGIPYPNGVQVSGILDAGAVSKFLGRIIVDTPRLGGIVIFPYGIPWPEIFRVNIDIGGPVEFGAMNEF
jgi:hypothetical protein